MRSPFIDSFRVMFTMDQKEVIVIGMIAAFMLAAAAITVKSAEATNNGETQTSSSVDDCGNDFVPIDVLCQNPSSQVDGDGNAVIIRGKQGSTEETSIAEETQTLIATPN